MKIKILLLSLMLCSVGCPSWRGRTKINRDIDLKKESSIITTAGINIENAANSIDTKAGDIISVAEIGLKSDPSFEEFDEIKNDANDIKENVQIINEHTNKISNSGINLDILSNQFSEMSKEYDKLIKENEKLKDSVKSTQKKIWGTVMGICSVSLFVGVFLIIYGHGKFGIATVGASLTMSCISYFMAEYTHIVGFIGGGILLGTIGYLLYMAYTEHRTLSDTIKSAELIKSDGWTRKTKDRILSIQHKASKNIIDKIKNDEGLRII